ncbi:NADPH-dependent oxidoreductase [Macrococcus hajekii]|uniref:FMN-dependent NADPH-azoreductase n=1 Tax=Macrococcus hajekii TaxID=198482 RepID=A0A4R6BJ69_9STAP|nr:NAD(P)H-dependent oxidoreductase [Macrococcus hajekii]TDM01735.1 NADPH-dependent oxidoreductase [Macrococcus hajekii]GGB06946.1 FMN reductase [Macrococcus hajekii]
MSKKVLVINGSDREGSFNGQLASQLVSELENNGVNAEVLDYTELPLLSQNNEYPNHTSVTGIRGQVKESDALIFVSPEYNGSYSARLKNLVDWLSRPTEQGNNEEVTVINGKPVAVASAANSTYGKFVRKNLNELVAYTRMKPMDHEGLGIKIPGSAWGSGQLELEEEQQQKLQAFVKDFIAFIG